MTATTPDVDQLLNLDFEPEHPCEINRCWSGDAQPGVLMLIVSMSCCSLAAPVCADHVPVVMEWIAKGMNVTCMRHGGTTAVGATMQLVPIR